ncbi:hypothetical protein pdam_00024089 [Pocillopora damicornis]|uniref:Uncharacterized protein n=1 Tax=Pocillopora damicornis TaxID=46731 RepID=A0A3M6UET7_POCDA|nr:hypothetical protein pdam_00024089 [Pocillopora damicornis]
MDFNSQCLTLESSMKLSRSFQASYTIKSHVICKYRAARQYLNCSRLYSLNRQCQKQIANRQLIPPKCNKRFLSREELVDQVAQEQVRRKHAEEKERYWHNKYHSEALVVDEENSEDLDSMKNLEIVVRNGKHKFAAFVELGEAHDHMEKLMGNAKPSLATRVLQFIFLSDCGFRFAMAQFPSGHFSPTNIYLQFWKAVQKMTETGLNISWCILDGADCNHQFIKLHFDKDPVASNFVTRNLYTGPMMFIMDCKSN